MSFFSKKNETVCLNEIKAASDFVSQTFQAPINLGKLKDQIEVMIEDKISKYYHERFKDWTVADLIMLAQTINKEMIAESKVDARGRKAKVGQVD